MNKTAISWAQRTWKGDLQEVLMGAKRQEWPAYQCSLL